MGSGKDWRDLFRGLGIGVIVEKRRCITDCEGL